MDIQFNSMEIILEEDDADDISLGNTIKACVPRVGEYIWMPYNWDRKNELGRAFIVTDVAHHIGIGMKCSYDSVVVYVNKVSKEKKEV